MTELNQESKLLIKEGTQKISPAISPAIVAEVKNTLTDLIKKDGLSDSNLMHIVTNLMSVVSQFTILSGSQKKELILCLIEDCIESNVKDPAILQMMIKNVVPGAIDLIIDISKKVYTFNAKKCNCFG